MGVRFRFRLRLRFRFRRGMRRGLVIWVLDC